MGNALLYNISDPGKRMKIKLCLYKLGIGCIDVAPEDFGRPVGQLLGLETAASGEDAEPFSEEMLVMHALSSRQFSALLDALRRERVPVALKAVVTETNQTWSSSRLHRELAAEHAAMRRKAGSPHAGKKR